MKFHFKLLTLIAFIFSSQLVMADSTADDSYSQPGFYFGGSVLGYNHVQPAYTPFNPLGGINLGVGGFIGYQFDPFISVQLNYNALDSESEDASSGSFLNGPGHYYLSEGDLLAKGSYPLLSRLVLNAYVGFAVVNENTYNELTIGEPPIVNTNITEVMPEIGGGLSFYFTHHFSMDAAVYEIFQVGQIKSITLAPVVSLTGHI